MIYTHARVVERHMIRGLEEIFLPVFVNGLSDTDIVGVASELATTQRHRAFLADRIAKLEEGHEALKRVMKRTTL